MPEPVTKAELFGLFGRPPSRIIAFFRKKGYTISFDWRDVWQFEHDRAFTVAKAMTDEILEVLRTGVDSAIDDGWSGRRFIRELTPALQKEGWWGKQQLLNPSTGKLQEVQLGSPWRLKTIHRTNTSVAFNRGRYQTQIASSARRPIWVYDARNDSLTRPSHRDLDNRAYRFNDPIWSTIYPPNGFNCRCIVRALTEDQARERGVQVRNSAQLPKPDNFPDKGWEFNPASEGKHVFDDRIEAKQRTRLQTLGDKLRSFLGRGG